MIIHKIINNNIVSSLDENHNEIILMGRGIAYQKSRGEVVPDEMIEKQFYLKNDKQNNRFLVKSKYLEAFSYCSYKV